MTAYIYNLFESVGFLPQGYSYFWQPSVLITNVLGDSLAALAYFSITPVLLLLVIKRKDFTYQSAFLLFTLFLFLCGILHSVEIITVWLPVYKVQGFLKVITGGVSIFAAYLLYRSMPLLLRMPIHKRLEQVNLRLRNEIAEREQAQIALREANEALETRVQQRTAQLIKTNRELEKEIEQRKKTEQDLLEKNLELMRINNSLNQQSTVNGMP